MTTTPKPLQAQSPSWSQPSSVPGPSATPDGSEAVASVCHDSAATAAAGEGASNPPSSAAPSGDARSASRAAVVAAYEEEYGERVVIDDFRRFLHSYADVAVDAFLKATWAAAIEPLVQHVPEDSHPATGVVEGGDPAEGGAAVTSVGGEVVPEGHVGVPAGTTEPEADRPCGCRTDDECEAATRAMGAER